MSLRLNRMWLLPFLLLSVQAWALGLGEIRLSSALNQPLRAEIDLLSATPEELNNLTIQLASAETFDRYDLDRPLYLTRIDFEVVSSGRIDGNFVRVTSSEPISEPFVTFLVEAAWSRGRLLREYTLLLDPPTFAPPPTNNVTQTVTAPSRATPADSGQIQRPAPAPQAARPQAPPSAPTPAQAAPQNTGQQDFGQAAFDATPGGDIQIQRGETLWGIASRVRPDSRLSINQTMLAIYQANPQAFDGNINLMRAGASLRIPSADDIFRITRGDALVEVQRQNSAWGGEPGLAPVDTTPSLTLVPPDEEDEITLVDEQADAVVDVGLDAVDAVEDVFVDPVDTRINEIQAILDDQDALLEIPDNELAALRTELANLRGEEPPVDVVDDTAVDDLLSDEEEDLFVDEGTDATDPVLDTTDDVADTQPSVPAVVTSPAQEDGIVDTIMGYVSNVFVLIGVALVAAILLLVWFMRRAANRDDQNATGVWDALDADEFADNEPSTSTERLKAMEREDEDSILVVETEQEPDDDFMVDTMETPIAPAAAEAPLADAAAATGVNKSLDDTFSSETAINLDQSDPVAEADFHMAYGLYDQAADLINGALAADPQNEGLLSKLCEIYFVWGNRDAFVDAAGRMKPVSAASGSGDWDKIIIMGQQIAGDHELFSGVSAEGATKAVDLSFDGAADEESALDIDFAGGPDGAVSDVIDLGAESGDIGSDTGQVSISPDSGEDIDFDFSGEDSVTREMPSAEDLASTVETPTIEEQFSMDPTGELPTIAETDVNVDVGTPEGDSTAEINLDDLGLDLGGLDETAVATDIADDDIIDSIGDFEDTSESPILEDPDETGKNEALVAAEPLVDPDETGRNEVIDEAQIETGTQQTLEVDELLAGTGELPSLDDTTGLLEEALGDEDVTQLAPFDDTGVDFDSSLLDATGQTQILTDDMAVDTGIRPGPDFSSDTPLSDDAPTVASGFGEDETVALSDDAATMLASTIADDDGEFDFAKTEALPKDMFSSDMSTDETGRLPELAGSTDLDLDLDDLTAALKVSEVGDTVNQVRDDATVEQPRIKPPGSGGETAITQALAPEDLSGDLHEARTMTEVGTKLDLARAYVDMGDPSGARSILEEVLDEGDEGQKQQAQQLLESLPA